MSRTGISYSEVSIPLRYGTTEVYEVPRVGESMIVSIPLRYGTTFITQGGSIMARSVNSSQVRYNGKQDKYSFLMSRMYFVSIPLRYGTTENEIPNSQSLITTRRKCQFLLGTVQQQSFPAIINIVLYFFQKFNHFSSKKSVDLFSCLTLIISI